MDVGLPSITVNSYQSWVICNLLFLMTHSFSSSFSTSSFSSLFLAAKARRDVENEKAVVQVVLGK